MEKKVKKNRYMYIWVTCYTVEIKHSVVYHLYFNIYFLKMLIVTDTKIFPEIIPHL